MMMSKRTLVTLVLLFTICTREILTQNNNTDGSATSAPEGKTVPVSSAKTTVKDAQTTVPVKQGSTHHPTPKPTTKATTTKANNPPTVTPKPTTKAPTTKANNQTTITPKPTTKVPTTKVTTPPTVTPKTTTKAPTTKANNQTTITPKPTTKVPTTKVTTPPTVTPKTTTKAPTTKVTTPPTVTPKTTTKAPTTKASNPPTVTPKPTTKAPTTKVTNPPTVKPKTTTKAPTTKVTTPPTVTPKTTTKAPTTKASNPPTEAPTTKANTQTTVTPNPPTKAPTTKVTNPPTITPNPPTKAPTTKVTNPPTITPNPPTKAPTTKVTNPPTATPNPPTKAPTTKPSTTKPLTEKPHTDTPPPSGKQLVYINEISVDKDGHFKKIEIQLSDQLDKSHYAVAVVGGTTLKFLNVMYLSNYTIKTDNYMLLDLDGLNTILDDSGIGIAIYDLEKSHLVQDAPLDAAGLVDALVIRKTYKSTDLPDRLVNTLTPDMDPFVVDPSHYGVNKSISRCSYKFMRQTDMYALLNSSLGNDNTEKCKAMKTVSSSIELQLSGGCDSFLYKNDSVKDDLMMKKMIRSVVKEVNRKCQCGITRLHIVDPEPHCCKGLNLKMTFTASTNERLDSFKSSFSYFRKQETHLSVDGTLYQLNNKCYQNCCEASKPDVKPQKDDSKAKNVKVTVAVIVSCLLVFMIIVVVVIVYMKSKKKAVYQFRMSRLQEEEDDDGTLMDQDDFIGGQEATFDCNRA